MNDAHREVCKRQHYLIGHYLALEAWIRGLDCIALERSDLEAFLGLERFKSVRIGWLKEDLKPWFPYQKAYFQTGAASSIHSLFLSRVPMDQHLTSDSMTTAQRIAAMEADAPRTKRFSTKFDGSEVPTQSEIVSQLSVFAAGLEAPKRKKRRRVKKKAKRS